jgi:CHAT domain-containing protein
LTDAERSVENPDKRKLDLWNEIILLATNARDSLKKEFAKNYPEYYLLKYDTRVVGISDIQKLIGNNKNYISYVVSDSVLYIMVVNSQYARIETVRIDTAFSNAVQRYRRLLSTPDRNSNASIEFNMFQADGYFLYASLVKPVRPFLISDELILSPDNTLAYFPFETLITSEKTRDDLQYRALPYLMKEFRISYAYSATLLSESPKTKRTYRNRLIAFAPSYKKPVDLNSLWVNRQQTDGTLPELKYASEEAAYVAKLTSGKLFRDSSASKRLFNSMAGSFDIIHLAMHTVLNNNDPSNSGMIFSDSDTLRDNTLRPYEIYAIRLNSKMVVLSSCFTGAGTLFAGEGVLSIARGFIFAGSRSVVMSLWEVDDRSGTEIIKSFYRNLKSGRSKSESLRKARIDYLKKADMLHSHPYFWSTMVIYGDDSPVYISFFTRIMFLLIPLLLGFFVFNYFRRR